MDNTDILMLIVVLACSIGGFLIGVALGLIKNKSHNKKINSINQISIDMYLNEMIPTIIDMSKKFDGITDKTRKDIAHIIYIRIKENSNPEDLKIINFIKEEKYINYIYNVLLENEEDNYNIEEEIIEEPEKNKDITIKPPKKNNIDKNNKDISNTILNFYTDGEDV